MCGVVKVLRCSIYSWHVSDDLSHLSIMTNEMTDVSGTLLLLYFGYLTSDELATSHMHLLHLHEASKKDTECCGSCKRKAKVDPGPAAKLLKRT